MGKNLFNYVKKNSLAARLIILLVVVFLITTSILPLMLGSAKAVTGQLTVRSLALSSGIPSATGVTYSYTFTTANAASVQSIKFVACTTAFQTYSRESSSVTTGCTAPPGMNINLGSQSGTNGFNNTTAFAKVASTTGNCAPANNVLCVNRTQAASEPAAAKTIAWTTQTNPSTANTAFYIGVYTYSDNAFATPVDSGTVASAVVTTLTIDARVAETLNFCVGSTAVDNATSAVPGDCTSVSGSAVNLGTLDSSSPNISPVTTNGGDSNNGIAMVRSNAANGTTVAYRAVPALTGANHLGTLRISGSTCSTPSNSNSDGCINAAGGTQTAFTAGTEDFGMTIAGINNSSISASSYSCAYGPSGNTCNLEPQTNYLGQGGSGTEAYGSGNGFAWDESGSPVTIASSSASTIKQIDDEAMILKFAASSNIITPFGSYSVQADFIAVPTY